MEPTVILMFMSSAPQVLNNNTNVPCISNTLAQLSYLEGILNS